MEYSRSRQEKCDIIIFMLRGLSLQKPKFRLVVIWKYSGTVKVSSNKKCWWRSENLNSCLPEISRFELLDAQFLLPNSPRQEPDGSISTDWFRDATLDHIIRLSFVPWIQNNKARSWPSWLKRCQTTLKMNDNICDLTKVPLNYNIHVCQLYLGLLWTVKSRGSNK